MIFSEWNWDTALKVAHEEGREEEKIIIARNLLLKGSTPEFVYEVTGLSLDEINDINL